jgi:TolB-like protein/DNA-binding winged helix-turn-helix (wHTH) protein/Tfp pilus assembly protein PilF
MGALTQSQKVHFDAFAVDLRAGEIYKHGIRLKLQDQPFRVLTFLLERPGDIVTREELRRRLWPADTFVDFDTGLNSAIKKLRDALGDSAGEPRYIETLPRRGYRFIGSLGHGLGAGEPGPEAPADGNKASEPSQIPGKRRGETPGGHLRLFLALALVLGTVTLAAFFAFTPHGRSGNPPAPIKSLAVLPLANLSGDSAQDYLAEGMTEEMIGRLSMIRGLRVVSRTSVLQFKGSRTPAPVVAKTLGVDALVEGSVIRDGGHVRVHAQLIRAATDEHFWSETYDREMGDALALESEVAQAIAAKVQVTLTGEERERLVAARHVAPEVYESYLKGQFVQGNTRADIEKSLAFFEDAIRRDATFAPAYVGIATAYDRLGTVFVGLPPQRTRLKVIDAAQKALALDPGLAQAHVLLADVYQRQWRWREAEAEFKRALDLKPNDAEAHMGFANWLMCQGRTEEALTWSRRARELEPLGVNGHSLAWILYNARQNGEAIRELRSDLAVHPDVAISHWYLGFALIDNGQPEEAIPELERTVSLTNRSPGAMGVLIRAYAKAGRRPDALRMLAELKKRRESGYVPAGAFVNAYIGLEDYDQTFVWLEKAYQEQSNILQFLKVHPFFDPIREDPRYKDLLRRVGLGPGS